MKRFLLISTCFARRSRVSCAAEANVRAEQGLARSVVVTGMREAVIYLTVTNVARVSVCALANESLENVLARCLIVDRDWSRSRVSLNTIYGEVQFVRSKNIERKEYVTLSL